MDINRLPSPLLRDTILTDLIEIIEQHSHEYSCERGTYYYNAILANRIKEYIDGDA